MTSCAICANPIEPFMSFGRMPIANGFLTPEQFASEPRFELATGFCERCKMVQLTSHVDAAMMFHENYAFFSSTSRRMAAHFEELANAVRTSYLGPDPFVVEIGSNDGVLLRHFARTGTRHLGVEPSANVAAVARTKGVNTVCEFFDQDLAGRIVAEHGPADALIGANVMCHIPDLHAVLEAVKILLKPAGVLIFEDPYLGEIMRLTSYDQIYDEHAFYFSVLSLDYLLAQHGLELVDLAAQPTHGGSMRYVVGRAGSRPVSPAVEAQRRYERHAGLADLATYQQFRQSVERSRDELTGLLRRLKSEGRRVTAYGATSKSTTVTNYCGLTADLIEFISDTTPIKQGKFSPGAHIPVRPHAEFATDYPDYSLLFAWNHAQEILANETAFTAAGGKWIVYVPHVGLLD